MQTWHNMPPEHASVAQDVPKTWTTNFFYGKAPHPLLWAGMRAANGNNKWCT